MSELTLPARVALVGNPNSGKTALFNALTGSRQKVANYPGVTVERKEGLAVTPAGLTVRLIDLPGTYSLRARSLDEVVTRDIVLGRRDGEDVPGLLVCVADSTNLRVALRLALELSRVGRPMILALNMFDIARHRGLEIDLERCRPNSAFRLSRRLPCGAAARATCSRASTRSFTSTGGRKHQLHGQLHGQSAGRSPTPRNCAPCSGRPTASSIGRSKHRGGRTALPAGSIAFCCTRFSVS